MTALFLARFVLTYMTLALLIVLAQYIETYIHSLVHGTCHSFSKSFKDLIRPGLKTIANFSEQGSLERVKIILFLLITFLLLLIPFSFFPLAEPLISENGKLYLEIIGESNGMYILGASILLYTFLKLILQYSDAHFELIDINQSAANNFLSGIFFIVSFYLLGINKESRSLHSVMNDQMGSLFEIFPAWNLYKAPISALLFILSLILSVPSSQSVDIKAQYKSSKIYWVFRDHQGIFSKIILLTFSIYFAVVYMGGYNIPGILAPIINHFPSSYTIVQIFSMIFKIVFVQILIFWIKAIFPATSKTSLQFNLWIYGGFLIAAGFIKMRLM